jgi:hypothetical protein
MTNYYKCCKSVGYLSVSGMEHNNLTAGDLIPMKRTFISKDFSATVNWKAAPVAALLTLLTFAADAQVGIGTTTPHASAQLDVTSDAKGVLVPRLTTVQRTAIPAPADGLLVYDSDTKGFWYFKSGTGWAKIDEATLALPYAGTGNAASSLFSITGQGAGTAVEGIADGEGLAGRFEVRNAASASPAITVKTVGNGTAGNFMVDRTTGTSPAVKGEVNSQFANFGTAGIYGVSSGTAGMAGLFYSSNPAGSGPALIALTEGSGNGITVNAGGRGNGVDASADGNGSAIYGWTPNFGTGRAARFANFNSANNNSTVLISTAGTGSTLQVNHTGTSGNLAVFQSAGSNIARISKTGLGYFNGGTQNSGADIAEAFDVINDVSGYEPGDVLSIATSRDRTIEKSAEAYSDLVLGVYATKPGVLLTEENIDSDLKGKVPMGVVGVIPTKVCGEGGMIRRGDLLVTSSIPGVAMKADKGRVQAGQILGKALQNFDGNGVGKINVFVNVK